MGNTDQKDWGGKKYVRLEEVKVSELEEIECMKSVNLEEHV